MKKLIFTAILLLNFGAFAQTLEPEFSFQLYFEDAAGNRDTVTIGYDADASKSIDLAFDEENILNMPWSDSLDVRIGDLGYSPINWYNVNYQGIDTNTFLTKKKIINQSCPYQPNQTDRVSIQIYTDNLPLTVRWDKSFFQGDENCRQLTSFFGKEEVFQHWDAAPRISLGWLDSLTIISSTFNEEEYQTDPNSDVYIRSYLNDDKKIITLQFIFAGGKKVGVSSNEKENELSIYPNPIQKGNFINISFIGNYSMFDVHGKLVQKGKTENNQITTNQLQKGMYFLQLENDKTQLKTKIIVQ